MTTINRHQAITLDDGFFDCEGNVSEMFYVNGSDVVKDALELGGFPVVSVVRCYQFGQSVDKPSYIAEFAVSDVIRRENNVWSGVKDCFVEGCEIDDVTHANGAVYVILIFDRKLLTEPNTPRGM